MMNVESILQLGPLAVVLIYVIVRLERSIGSMTRAIVQQNKILMLLLKHTGMSDAEVLELCNEANGAVAGFSSQV